MAKETSNAFNLGLFVITGTLLFVAAVYFMGNQQNLLGRNFVLSVDFSNVNGLQAGNNVRFNGIDVGTIRDIRIVSDSSLRVNMLIRDEVQPFIRQDAIASIGSDGLVGNMLVNISPGTSAFPPVADGGIIQSFTRTEANDIMNTLGKTNENIALISHNLLEITDQIRAGEGTLAMLLRDASLAEDLKATAAQLRATSTYLANSSQTLQGLTDAVADGEGLLGQLTRDTLLLSQVSSSLYALDSLLQGGLGNLFQELEASAANINQTSQRLDKITADLQQGKGPAGTLLNNETAAEDLRQMLDNLNQGTARFNENMEALKHSFLFRAYFRRQAKNLEEDK
ncbi:MAG: MlaD family protein [Saprospiraceae bacterium]|nr:MlaD family protein [Saprospiraceae bacterium]